MQLCKAASRYRTESGSDRMLHSTCDRQSHSQEGLWDQVECQRPVTTALGSVNEHFFRHVACVPSLLANCTSAEKVNEAPQLKAAALTPLRIRAGGNDS